MLAWGITASVGQELKKPIATTKPPPGFEELTGPQTTLVDVYRGGRFIGTTLATIDQEKLRFHNPLEVISRVPSMKDADAILRALSGPLDLNSHLQCPAESVPGCGVLEPVVAGVIVDIETYRVEVFINADLLDIQRVDRLKYLPASEAGPAIITAMAGSISDTNDSKESYSVRNRTVIGRQDDRIRIESSHSTGEQFFLDTAFLESDAVDNRYFGGLFRFRGLDSVNEERILGVGFNTTADTRVDVDVAFGRQLVVFLARRSQIDVLRDGRLISSRLYEAGNQTIDTSELPDGAYDVTLRIREIGGETREETQFFIKTESLPPEDTPLYYLEGGILTDDTDRHIPSTVGTPIVRLGTLHRLRDNLGVGGDLLLTKTEGVAELRALYFGRKVRLRGVGLVTSDGDYGMTGAASGTWLKLAYSVSMRRSWAVGSRLANSTTVSRFEPISISRTEGRASVYYQLGASRIGLQGLWQDTSRDNSTYSYGPTLSYQIFNTGNALGTLSADYTRSRNQTTFTSRIRVRRNYKHVGLRGTAGYRGIRKQRDFDEKGRDAGVNVTWNDRDVLPGDLSLTGGVNTVVDRDSASHDGRYNSELGRFSFSSDRQRTPTAYTTSYSGNMNLNWLTNRDGVVVGGREAGESAVVVKVKGNAKDAKFDVLVNGVRRTTVAVGEALPVMLTPYNMYNIRLEPVTADFIHYDQEPREVVLYPGNVTTLIWGADKIQAVFGRIVRGDGIPVGFARIHGVVTDSFTDELGYFQAEMTGPGTLTFVPPRGGTCEVEIKNLGQDQVFARLGTLVCNEQLEASDQDVQIADLDEEEDGDTEDQSVTAANTDVAQNQSGRLEGSRGATSESNEGAVQIASIPSNVDEPAAAKLDRQIAEAPDQSKVVAAAIETRAPVDQAIDEPEPQVAVASPEGEQPITPAPVSDEGSVMPLAAPNSEANVAMGADGTEASEEIAIGGIEQPIPNPEPNGQVTEAIDQPQIDVVVVETAAPADLATNEPQPRTKTDTANAADDEPVLTRVSREDGLPTSGTLPSTSSDRQDKIEESPSYIVQLASFRRVEAVEEYGTQLLDEHGDILGSVPIVVAAIESTDHAIFHLLGAGPFGLQVDAWDLCRRLRSRAVECEVMQY